MVKLKLFFQFLKRVWDYLPVLWHDRDWDYYHLFTLLQFKLKRMSEDHRTDIWGSNAKRKADELHTCVLLLERLRNDDYCPIPHQEHTERWGEIELVDEKYEGGCRSYCTKRANIMTEADQTLEFQEAKAISTHENYLRTQDLDYLFVIIKKHVWSWWI